MLSPSQKMKFSLKVKIHVCFFQHKRYWAITKDKGGSVTGAEFRNFNSFNIYLIFHNLIHIFKIYCPVGRPQRSPVADIAVTTVLT